MSFLDCIKGFLLQIYAWIKVDQRSLNEASCLPLSGAHMCGTRKTMRFSIGVTSQSLPGPPKSSHAIFCLLTETEKGAILRLYSAIA